MRLGLEHIRLNGILGKPPAAQQKPSRLGTIILPPYGGAAVECVEGIPRRCISRLANGYTYSFMLDISQSDVRGMEAAKARIISLFSSNDLQGLPSLPEVRRAAQEELLNTVSPEKAPWLSYVIAHDTVGYGPISMFMEDKQNIEEIEIGSPESPIIIYSTKYGRCITNAKFSSEPAFRSAINRMIIDTDKEISETTPIVDAQVADLRVHAQIRPYAVSGAAASIRMGGKKEIGLSYMLAKKAVTPHALSYLWMAMECGYNMIISGAPASGKTTFLSALNAFMPSNEKVITIEEDVNEMSNQGFLNVVALYGSRYGSVTPKEQVINALRMRPRRIIIGEMRADEARDLFMGANIGISFAATMHSNEGGMQILKKLMVRPMSVDPRGLGALDIAVYMRQADISQRLVCGIFEYRWLSRAETDDGEKIGEDELVKIVDIVTNGVFDRSALQESKMIDCYCRINGISAKEAIKEFDRRSKLIEKSAQGQDSRSVEKSVAGYLGW